MYTGGGGGNSHLTVAKFQYMPGGQGGGGGSAWPTAGEASSISGRTANTTADKALRCSQGFIAHLLSVAFCVEILRFVQSAGARFSADGGDHGNDGVHWVAPKPSTVVVAALSASEWSETAFPGIRDFCVVTCERYEPSLQWRICLRALASGLIVWPHRMHEALPPRSRK
jgi:hypothetical protein